MDNLDNLERINWGLAPLDAVGDDEGKMEPHTPRCYSVTKASTENSGKKKGKLCFNSLHFSISFHSPFYLLQPLYIGLDVTTSQQILTNSKTNPTS